MVVGAYMYQWTGLPLVQAVAITYPLRAKIFRGNINIYLHFVSFRHIDVTQVVEIIPQIKQDPISST